MLAGEVAARLGHPHIKFDQRSILLGVRHGKLLVALVVMREGIRNHLFNLGGHLLEGLVSGLGGLASG